MMAIGHCYRCRVLRLDRASVSLFSKLDQTLRAPKTLLVRSSAARSCHIRLLPVLKSTRHLAWSNSEKSRRRKERTAPESSSLSIRPRERDNAASSMTYPAYAACERHSERAAKGDSFSGGAPPSSL